MARKSKKKAETTEQTPEIIPEYSASEQPLVDKYLGKPWHIKPQSLRPPGERPEFGKKPTLIIICQCGQERTVTTQDLFQIKGCKDCTARIKKEEAKAKRQAKKETKP